MIFSLSFLLTQFFPLNDAEFCVCQLQLLAPEQLCLRIPQERTNNTSHARGQQQALGNKEFLVNNHQDIQKLNIPNKLILISKSIPTKQPHFRVLHPRITLPLRPCQTTKAYTILPCAVNLLAEMC